MEKPQEEDLGLIKKKEDKQGLNKTVETLIGHYELGFVLMN